MYYHCDLIYKALLIVIVPCQNTSCSQAVPTSSSQLSPPNLHTVNDQDWNGITTRSRYMVSSYTVKNGMFFYICCVFTLQEKMGCFDLNFMLFHIIGEFHQQTILTDIN